jgi:hypothetical protein
VHRADSQALTPGLRDPIQPDGRHLRIHRDAVAPRSRSSCGSEHRKRRRLPDGPGRDEQGVKDSLRMVRESGADLRPR